MTFHNAFDRASSDLSDTHTREQLVLRSLRMEIELTVERFVHLLDAIDSISEDMEEDDEPGVEGGLLNGRSEDAEPSLGWPETFDQSSLAGAPMSWDFDLEASADDEGEPELGWPETVAQPELGPRACEGEADESDDEPSLGAPEQTTTDTVSQVAWARGGDQDLEHDWREPELFA